MIEKIPNNFCIFFFYFKPLCQEHLTNSSSRMAIKTGNYCQLEVCSLMQQGLNVLAIMQMLSFTRVRSKHIYVKISMF